MRYLLGTTILAISLAACASSPNDGDEYWDNITPDPASLERTSEEERLKRAEQPQTVQLPSDTQPVAKPQTGDTVTVDIKRADPPKAEGDGSISNSQDFETVKASETIETDAAKLEQLKGNYEIVKPGAAPRRGSNINLAKYALAQTNPAGQKVHTRNPLKGRKAAEKCANYGSDDEAQTAFLQSGGPQRDTHGIDPDGDGYACGWNPAVYRSLIGQ